MTIVEKVQNWVSLPNNVTDENLFKQGATLLLQMNRSNYMYNFLVRGWRSNTQKAKLIYEINKHLRILLSGITVKQIAEMKPVADKIGREVESLTMVSQSDKTEIKVSSKGMRADHDQLPPHIKALFTETLNLLRKERSLHEKLKMMEDAKPCDRHEYVSMLIKLDKKRRKDWAEYDSYKITGNDKVTEAGADVHQTITAENINDIGNCRTFISRNIGKAVALKNDPLKVAEYSRLVAEIKSKYEMASALGANFADSTITKLKTIDVL